MTKNVLIMALIFPFISVIQANASCVLHETSWTVCTPWQCYTTVQLTWICSGGGDSGGDGSDGGDTGGSNVNVNDLDRDGYLDDWAGVLDTTDPCANNFDRNDRLGSNFGGPNTTRPDHAGVDIQANDRDRVNAMADGTVHTVGWHFPNDRNRGCGFWVRLNHRDGSQSIYCHLNANDRNPNVGDVIRAGDQLGTADSTGNSTGDHLHLVYWDAQGNREEYFDHTDTRPGANQLNNNGC